MSGHINEDGEFSEHLSRGEIRARWSDAHADNPLGDDTREFSAEKRMVKPDPRACQVCASDQEFVRGLCKKHYFMAGQADNGQPSHLWEVDEPETKSRLAGLIHGVSKHNMGYSKVLHPVQFSDN